MDTVNALHGYVQLIEKLERLNMPEEIKQVKKIVGIVLGDVIKNINAPKVDTSKK